MACMNQEKITHFKKRLGDELQTIENELKGLGWKNEAGEWEAQAQVDTTATESDELADRMEEYQENRAEIDELQITWNNIKRALDKIEEGTYGTCEISGEEIEEERLEANPSARTCVAHMEEEKDLTS